jgi:hypothetical protein
MIQKTGRPAEARQPQLRYPARPDAATLAYLRRRRKKRMKGGGAVTVPDAFAFSDWSVVNAGTGGDVDVLLHAHPANGGSAIIDIEYRVDGGSWVSSGGVLHFPISGLTDDFEVNIEIRAVNAVGSGSDSDDKAVTTTATYPEPLAVTPRLVVLDSIMTEGGVLVFNVCRKHPYGTSSVNYTINDGTAVVDTDYDNSANALTGTLNFADRELFKTISIQTLTRGGAQGSRTLTCTLSSPTDAVVDDDMATGTIQDGTITVFTEANSLEDIHTAIEAGSPGDAFLFTRGDEWAAGSLTFDQLAGTAANPIIIGATGAGAMPKLVDVGIWFRGRNTDDASKYVILQDLHFKSEALPGSRNSPYLISEASRTFKPDHITLIRNRLENTPEAIVVIDAGGDQTIECCEFVNNFSIAPEGGHSQGIFFSDQDGRLQFNRFKNNGKANYPFDWHTYLSHAGGTTYEYNFLSGGPDGIKVRTDNGITVRGNEVYGTDLVGISAGSDSGGPNLTDFLAEENYVHGGQDGFFITSQSGVVTGSASGILRNNIAVAVEPGGLRALLFDTESGNENWKVYNNIFLTDGKAVVEVRETIAGSEMRNNVFARLDANSGLVFNITDATVQASFTGSNNLFHGNGGDILAVGGATNTPYATLAAYNVDFAGAEDDSVEGDPTFVDQTNGDYMPDAGSPLIEAGFDTTVDVPADFNGTARTDPVDIGIAETMAAASAPVSLVDTGTFNPGFSAVDPATFNFSVDLGSTSVGRSVINVLARVDLDGAGDQYESVLDPAGDNVAYSELLDRVTGFPLFWVEECQTDLSGTQTLRYSWDGVAENNPNENGYSILELDGAYTITPGTPVATSSFSDPAAALANCNLLAGQLGLFFQLIQGNSSGVAPTLSRSDAEDITILQAEAVPGGWILIAYTEAPGTNFSITADWNGASSTNVNRAFLPMSLS